MIDPVQQPELYCEVCERDASDQVIIARWHDINVCLDCLWARDELVEEGLLPNSDDIYQEPRSWHKMEPLE